MKTPEEIKKGIECCLCDPMERRCEKCPYADGGCESLTCEKELGDATVALIQQYAEDRKAMYDLFRATSARVLALAEKLRGCMPPEEVARNDV